MLVTEDLLVNQSIAVLFFLMTINFLMYLKVAWVFMLTL